MARRHRHLQIDSKCLAHDQLSHLAQFVKHFIFKQTCWINFEPPPQLRDWKFESFMSTAFDILVKNCNEFPFSAGLQLTLQTGLRPRPGD